MSVVEGSLVARGGRMLSRFFPDSSRCGILQHARRGRQFVRRRGFIALLGAAIARPRVARAKNTAGNARIGGLVLAPPAPDDAFLERLPHPRLIERPKIPLHRTKFSLNIQR